MAAKSEILRLVTCGSVDDGKSTMIGRLLYDSQLLKKDQLVELVADSSRHGNGQEIDFSLLLDGLQSERQQGITIDVAYRYFATPKRHLIIADAPGHLQYTRNMATAASTAELALLLVDASKGVLTQTRRHLVVISLLGIRRIVLAVNKMDLIGFDRATFEAIAEQLTAFAERLGITEVQAIPISARAGDNVWSRSDRMHWYDGPSLIQHLEQVEVATQSAGPFRMPVQWVCRPDQHFRGYAGRIAGGRVAIGDQIAVTTSGITSRVASISLGDKPIEMAAVGQSVMLTLADDLEAGRGEVLAAADARSQLADQFGAQIIWMAESPLLPGRPYLLKIGTRTVSAQVTALKYRLDIDTLEHHAAETLAMNDIGFVHVSTAEPIPFDPYTANRDMGAFILIDRATNATVGAGMIAFELRRASHIHWQALTIDRRARAELKHQKPRVIWFTGLSGAGKSTIANLVEKKLYARGRHTTMLDGDNIRHGLNRDLGFTEAGRVENIRRVGEVARLMADAGLIVLVSFISPFRAERDMARRLMPSGEFVEVFVDASLAVCEARDPKGLYAAARLGKIINMTGLSSPYEPPAAPEIHLRTDDADPEILAEQVIDWLETNGSR